MTLLIGDYTEQEYDIYSGLNTAIKLSHKTAVDCGWYTDLETNTHKDRNFGEIIALIHSELSEAMEAHRKNLMDEKLPHRTGVEVELADCLIRIFDLAGSMDLDLGAALIEKNRYNKIRSDHKLENRKNGGKQY
jgi:NTP pyrophosphatase (non-canonical NTP hydrolase)